MKTSRVLALLLIYSLVSSAAAEAVLTQNFRVYSKNGDYFANLARKNGSVREFSIHQANSIDAAWSSWLEWGKGYSGYLSDDGSVFIAVNEEYSENNSLITVYYREKQESYSVKSIPMDKEKLTLSKGKYVWFDAAVGRARFLYDGSGRAVSFELVLVDNRVIGLELK